MTPTEIYKKENQLLSDWHNERRERIKITEDSLQSSLTERMSYENLIKAWFGFVEGTGGGASADKDSVHREERAMFYIEQAIKELEVNPLIHNSSNGK